MEDTNKPKNPLLSNAAYDKLKFLTQILLPAIGTLYVSLAGYWGFPNPEEVVGTIIAVDLFLGVALGLSTRQYNNSDANYDGTIVVNEDPDTGVKNADLILHNYENPADVVNQKTALFKIDSTKEKQ